MRNFKGSVSSNSRARMSILAVADMCVEAHLDTLRALLSMKLLLTASTDKKITDNSFIVSKIFFDGLQNLRGEVGMRKLWTLRCCHGSGLLVWFRYLFVEKSYHTYSNSIPNYLTTTMIWNLKNLQFILQILYIQLQQTNFWKNRGEAEELKNYLRRSSSWVGGLLKSVSTSSYHQMRRQILFHSEDYSQRLQLHIRNLQYWRVIDSQHPL